METEIRRVKQAIAAGPKGKSRRYTGALREDIVALTRVMRDQGKTWAAISRMLGVGQETLQRLYGAAQASNGRAKAPSFVPVVLRDDRQVRSNGLTLVSPRGHRIEGLDVATAADLLGRLS